MVNRFDHTSKTPKPPKRVVIFGSSGYVGKHVTRHLEENLDVPIIKVSSDEIDLTKDESILKIQNILKPEDSIIFLSAKLPHTGEETQIFFENIKMIDVLIKSIQKTAPNNLTYISSDAVYSMSEKLISEETATNPSNLYGLMHLTREKLLEKTSKQLNFPLAILRPTQIYGPGATHFPYGPNKMIKSAIEKKEIEIFGQGEDVRDFVHIRVVVECIWLSLMHSSKGILNIASGNSLSFYNLAKLIERKVNFPIKIINLARKIRVCSRDFTINEIKNILPRNFNLNFENELQKLINKQLNAPLTK